MKYIKRFNETDSWAGSAYAYGYTEPTGFTQTSKPTTEFPLKQTYLFKCDKCKVEFYAFEDEVICPICKFKQEE